MFYFAHLYLRNMGPIAGHGVEAAVLAELEAVVATGSAPGKGPRLIIDTL